MISRWPAQVSFGLSRHPLANEWRAALQDDTLSLRRGQEANGIDICEPQVLEVQRSWSATGRELRAHMFDVFRPHATDEANRGSVFADFGDDPESHSQGEPRHLTVVQWTGRLSAQSGQRLTGRRVTNRQNLLIRRQSDGRQARVSDS